MARKLPPDKIWIFPEGVACGDLFWGVVGAIVGGVVFSLAVAFPFSGGGSWRHGSAASVTYAVLSWALALTAYAVLGFFSFTLASVDVRLRRLPNGLVAWATCSTVSLLAVAGFLRSGWPGLVAPAVAAFLVSAVFFAIWARANRGDHAMKGGGPRGGFGGGDVKVTPVAAFAAMWPHAADQWLTGLFVFLLALSACFALALIVTIVGMRREIPASPVVFLASWAALALAPFAAG